MSAISALNGPTKATPL